MHAEKSPLAGKTVKIKEGAQHPQVEEFGGAEFRVEDWWDRVSGGSWMNADGNPACMVYAMRSGMGGEIPTDNEVLYGHVGAFGHLVHVSELDTEETGAPDAEADPVRAALIVKGEVPPGCTMPGQMAAMIAMTEKAKGRKVCWGCNGDRSECHGEPKR